MCSLFKNQANFSRTQLRSSVKISRLSGPTTSAHASEHRRRRLRREIADKLDLKNTSDGYDVDVARAIDHLLTIEHNVANDDAMIRQHPEFKEALDEFFSATRASEVLRVLVKFDGKAPKRDTERVVAMMQLIDDPTFSPQSAFALHLLAVFGGKLGNGVKFEAVDKLRCNLRRVASALDELAQRSFASQALGCHVRLNVCLCAAIARRRCHAIGTRRATSCCAMLSSCRRCGRLSPTPRAASRTALNNASPVARARLATTNARRGPLPSAGRRRHAGERPRMLNPSCKSRCARVC